MNYEAVIGLEVHVHLNTQTKAFCGCSTQFGNPPNSQVCPVCLGFPGSLPVLNKTALAYTIKVALALDCQVQEYTKFDRKNYFYPDLPKNYQISQFDLPLSKNGYLEIDLDGKKKRIGIRRVHLEEDAGKLIHSEKVSLVDFNRSGIPLIEIVSEPEISSPQEAYEYLVNLRSVIEYLDVSDCDMEKGSLRCDANVSLRKKGDSGLGTKTELKNMNSFKAVKDGLSFEITRQAELLNQGESVVQETRLWDEKTAQTLSMRTKEESQDYRYFPEPDLPAFLISEKEIAEIKKTIPELAREKKGRFMKEYAISEYDARILVLEKGNAVFAEACIKAYPAKDKKPIVNWLIGPLLSEANNLKCNLAELKIPGGKEELIRLVNYVEIGKISNLTAKSVLNKSLNAGKTVTQIIQEESLSQISDPAILEAKIEEVISENPDSLAAYRSGKTNVLMFLVGQVMKKTQGKANPKLVQEMLAKKLS